jgi:hypothetical protein
VTAIAIPSWDALAEKTLAGGCPTRDEALAVLRALTTPGQAAESDWAMLADLGFEIEACAL